MKFEKQVLDRCGPAQVGFDRNSGLSVYCEKAFTPPRLNSRALRLTHESGYDSLSPCLPLSPSSRPLFPSLPFVRFYNGRRSCAVIKYEEQVMRIAFLVTFVLAFGVTAAGQAQKLKTPLEKLEDQLKQPGKLPPPPSKPQAGYLGIDGESESGRVGVKIVAMKKDGPGAVAGLRVGDQVIALGHKKIKGLDQLAGILEKTKPGQRVSVTVERGRVNILVQVILGKKAAPSEIIPPLVKPPATQAPLIQKKVANSGTPMLGIRAIGIDPAVRARLALPVRQGAIITAIYPNTPAAKIGLPIGGVIVAISGTKIDSPDDIIRFLKSAKVGQKIDITYYNRGQLSKKNVLLERVARNSTQTTPPLVSPPLTGPVGNPRTVQRPLLNKLEGLLDKQAENERLSKRVSDLERDLAALRKRLADLEKRLPKK